MVTWLNAPFEMRFRFVGGLTVRFAASEDHDDHALLLSPWPESLLAFQPIWWHLAKRTHLVALDLPGFGHPQRSEPLLSPSAMGEFIIAAADAFGLSHPHVVAPSIGTAAARPVPRPPGPVRRSGRTRRARGRPSPGRRPGRRLPPARPGRLPRAAASAVRPSRSSTRVSNPGGASLSGSSRSSSSPVTVSRRTSSRHAVQQPRCASASARSRPVRTPSASSSLTPANPAHSISLNSLTACIPGKAGGP